MAGSLVKTFSCKNCGGTVTLRAAGFSTAAACQSCGSVIDARDPNFALISAYRKNVQVINPYLPLGSRGKLYNDLYEVIGIIQRRDSGGTKWLEYLLFNPQKGFRWLSEFEGHWNFVVMIKDKVESAGYSTRVKVNGKTYVHCYTTNTVVNHVLGEFYWKVKWGEQAGITEYIAPPESLVAERSDDEVVWSRAIYVSGEMIRDAFGIKTSLPPVSGIGANQPSPYASELGSLWFASCLFIGAMLVITKATSYNAVAYANFAIVTMFLLVFPLVVTVMHSSFESRRAGGDEGGGSDWGSLISGDDD